MDSERELVARCRRGEADAWDDLFERFYPLAGRFIYQLSPGLNLEDADEICQEVFLSVIRHLDSFRGNSSFQTWLYRIAANKTRDYIEKQHAAKRGGGAATFSLDGAGPGTDMSIDLPASAPGPDQQLMTAERMLFLRDALDQLGDPCREIIELKYFGDLTYGEIATELNLNIKTVSSRLSKCLDKLEEIARPIIDSERASPHSV